MKTVRSLALVAAVALFSTPAMAHCGVCDTGSEKTTCPSKVKGAERPYAKGEGKQCCKDKHADGKKCDKHSQKEKAVYK